MTDDYEYDVAFSFAGEEREYVGKVALTLQQAGIRVFYDEFENANLWGKNLYTHLSSIYKDKARYTVIFASKNYVRKLWTNHERESAQARAISEMKEYILPARFDDTEVPGLLNTVGFIDLRKVSPQNFAALIIEKLGKGADMPAMKKKRSKSRTLSYAIALVAAIVILLFIFNRKKPEPPVHDLTNDKIDRGLLQVMMDRGIRHKWDTLIKKLEMIDLPGKNFSIQRREVSRKLYDFVMWHVNHHEIVTFKDFDDFNSGPGGDNALLSINAGDPAVTSLTFTEIVSFINALNQFTEQHYRLPYDFELRYVSDSASVYEWVKASVWSLYPDTRRKKINGLDNNIHEVTGNEVEGAGSVVMYYLDNKIRFKTLQDTKDPAVGFRLCKSIDPKDVKPKDDKANLKIPPRI